MQATITRRIARAKARRAVAPVAPAPAYDFLAELAEISEQLDQLTSTVEQSIVTTTADQLEAEICDDAGDWLNAYDAEQERRNLRTNYTRYTEAKPPKSPTMTREAVTITHPAKGSAIVVSVETHALEDAATATTIETE